MTPIGVTLEGRAAEALRLLYRIGGQYPSAALASSFGAEDMVLTDLIARHRLPVAIFTLDTGRLPGETVALFDRVREHYGIPIEVYFPEARAVEAYVRDHGANAFYDSVALRQRCCAIRKSEPLTRALAGRAAWMTGQRRAQSVTRTALEIEEIDAAHAVPLTAVAAAGHACLGTIDYAMLLALLAGGVPGIVLGSLGSRRVPVRTLRMMLVATLTIAGVKLLA